MAKALLIIDYTNDFVADNGALTCAKPAQGLEGWLVQLATITKHGQEWAIDHFKNSLGATLVQ